MGQIIYTNSEVAEDISKYFSLEEVVLRKENGHWSRKSLLIQSVSGRYISKNICSCGFNEKRHEMINDKSNCIWKDFHE